MAAIAYPTTVRPNMNGATASGVAIVVSKPAAMATPISEPSWRLTFITAPARPVSLGSMLFIIAAVIAGEAMPRPRCATARQVASQG